MKAIYTVEWLVHNGSAPAGTKHKVVRYRGGECVKGNVHGCIPKEASSDAGLLAWQVFRVIAPAYILL